MIRGLLGDRPSGEAQAEPCRCLPMTAKPLGCPVALPWRSRGAAVGLLWRCYGAAVALPAQGRSPGGPQGARRHSFAPLSEGTLQEGTGS